MGIIMAADAPELPEAYPPYTVHTLEALMALVGRHEVSSGMLPFRP